MGEKTINPAPPLSERLSWRPVTLDDLDALVTLARICQKVDGGLPFMTEPGMVKERYFPNEHATGIGAFTPDGLMEACAVVQILSDSPKPKARILGQVHPDMRRQGIGNYLMHWSQAKALFTGQTAAPPVLQVSTESLTDAAHRLYQAHGFKSVFEELVMEFDLHQPLPEVPFPPNVTLTAWQPEQPELAEGFFQAYEASFRERPGFPGYSAAEWIAELIEDAPKPEWTFLARIGGAPVGFVLGYIDLDTTPPGAFISQVGVIPAERRRGLGSALMVASMRRMQAEGVLSAQLNVNVNNPGAIQSYVKLGYRTIGRRARYERILK